MPLKNIGVAVDDQPRMSVLKPVARYDPWQTIRLMCVCTHTVCVRSAWLGVALCAHSGEFVWRAYAAGIFNQLP